MKIILLLAISLSLSSSAKLVKRQENEPSALVTEETPALVSEEKPAAAVVADSPTARQAPVSPARVQPSPPKPPGRGPSSSGSSGPSTYVLPAGADEIIPNLRTTFSCDNRIYGYYADVDNECQVFHVCVPVTAEDGQQSSLMYSFFCGNQTIFDQERLICTYKDDALPCEQAAQFYDPINSNFGRTDKPPSRREVVKTTKVTDEPTTTGSPTTTSTTTETPP